MKNIIKKLRSFFFFFLFLYAIYHASLAYQYYSMKEKAENFEKNRSYSSIFQYNQKGGEPLFLVNPENKRTIFFMEGFRAQAPAGFYRDWFEELYQTGTNIIVPVYGLQSSPFELRNRDWRFQEDLRLANQVYEAYASAKSEEHEILLVAHSFGTLPALSIAVTAKRRPDGIILLSPLNTGMEFKAAGKLVYWFSKQTSWLQYLLLFTEAGKAPSRESIWDIVNPQKNRKAASKLDANFEDSSRYGYRVEKAAIWMEEELVPRVKDYRIFLAYGNSDLFFSSQGFENLGKRLEVSGNRVDIYPIQNSGHMVLMDNGEKALKEKILLFLRAKK